MTARVLIVDDEPDIRELLEITLGRMSLDTETAKDLTSARAALQRDDFNLCLTDMRLPDGDGIELVEHIQSCHHKIPVAVITAHGSTEAAIKALKAGAFDFVSKPVDLQNLRSLVQSALRLTDSEISNSESGVAGKHPSTVSITGNSPKIRRLKAHIDKLARSQAPVFISGESGSGKELAARAIHQQSSRRNGPFVAVNCGAIPADLMESELFGHLQGSFTGADRDKQGLFQAAEGGTLFLDEIADLPLQTQVKLLRVIQERAVRPVGSQAEESVDVRLLSATHKNLADEVKQGRLRQDLFYRINVIELSVPPLRERAEDLPELVGILLGKIAKENMLAAYEISDSAMQALANYGFPGNVRELENILQRAAMLCEDSLIDEGNLEFLATPLPRVLSAVGAPTEETAAHQEAADSEPNFSLSKHLETIEIEAIQQALEETRWNKTAAAKKLGMSFRSLRYRLKKLGLE